MDDHRPAPESISQEHAPCVLHKAHTPITIINELHHVFPQYLQLLVWGEVRDKERRSICSTSHNSVHAALSQYLRDGTWPSWCVGATRDLAQEGALRYEKAKQG